jgi:tape measure domain-containing protein
MSKLAWVLELQDRVSGAAKAAAASLGKVDDALRRLDSATNKFDARFKHVSKGISSMASDALAAGKKLDGAADKVAKFALAGGAIGAGLLAAGAAYAGKMMMFKENTLFAFKYITGSQAGAAKLFDDADKLARSMGQKTSAATESISELMAGGFDQKTAMALSSAIGDIHALRPDVDTRQISRQAAQMLGKGRINANDLQPMLDAGVDDSKFYEALSGITGIHDQGKLRKAMELGTVTAKQGISALLKGIQAQGGGGPLGSVAKSFSTDTVRGAFENMTAMVERLFMSINSGGAGSGLIKLMGNIAEAMDPTSESGQRLLGQIDKLVEWGGQAFQNIDVSKVISAVDTLTKSMEVLLKTSQGVLGALEYLGVIDLEQSNSNHQIEAGVQAYEHAAYRKRYGDEAANKREAAEKAALDLGEARIREKYKSQTYGTQLLTDHPELAGSKLTPEQQELKSWRQTGVSDAAVNPMFDLGRQAAEGFVAGLSSGGPASDAAGRALAQSAVTGARETLEIHSPSRVFAQMGAHTATGYAGGVEENAWRAEAAVAGMLEPPRISGFGASSFAGAAGQGSSVTVGDIHVTVGPGSEANGEAIAATIKRELTSYFDGMSLELGGGVT